MTEPGDRKWVDRPAPPLKDSEGRPVMVVHLATEYVPFARTGGLAEAANGLAKFSTFAGVPSAVIMPLHRSAREVARDLEEVGDPFEVRFGHHVHTARLRRPRQPRERAHVFFIEHDGFFDREGIYGEAGSDYEDNAERWAFFCLAALCALPRITDGPLILHAHDWHSALALTYLRTRYAGDAWYDGVRTVLSVHNAGYQGHLPAASVEDLGLPSELFTWRHLEWYGKLNLLKAGLVFADAAVTVSPNHARELRTQGGGFGLQEVFAWMGRRFTGIINGIDQRGWDPETDPEIAAHYSKENLEPKAACKTAIQNRFGLQRRSDMPLFGMAARLVTQKGLEIILAQPDLLALNAQFVFIGEGEFRFERALRERASGAPQRIAVDTNFTDALEHQLMAGADLLLMPCQYEPCGLTQMRAQRYGALPLVRRVGGLADTVDQGLTGLIFDAFEAEPLVGAALRGIDLFSRPVEWHQMMRAAMARDFSWELSVSRYLGVYRNVIAGRFRAPVMK